MFQFFDIASYHEDLLAGNTTCTEATAFYLDRIQQKKHLNAFVDVYAAEALKNAGRLDDARKRGEPMKSLHGVIVAIKNVICFKEHNVTAASKMLQGFTSLYTASALQFLIDEDAIIIGSCNCDEFAMGSSNENSAYGFVRNGLDESRVPGGSSGGSAVAVQMNMCMVALGSDTGGSVRQPADFCGIVGLKPGYGSISRYGLIAYASSFDQIGIFAKNISDAQLLLQMMAKPDERDATMTADPLPAAADKSLFRFAYFKEMLLHPSLDREIYLKITELITRLKQAGHTVAELSFDLPDVIVPVYYVLTTAEACSNLSRYDGVRYGFRDETIPNDLNDFYLNNRTAGFGKEVKRRIMLGSFVLSTGYYEAYFAKAQKIRRMLKKNAEDIFKSFDTILMPVSPGIAFPLGQKSNDPVASWLADIFTVFANLTGLPAVAVPLFSHSDNMPFGVQLLADRHGELTLLKIAETLETQFSEAALQ